MFYKKSQKYLFGKYMHLSICWSEGGGVSTCRPTYVPPSELPTYRLFPCLNHLRERSTKTLGVGGLGLGEIEREREKKIERDHHRRLRKTWPDRWKKNST